MLKKLKRILDILALLVFVFAVLFFYFNYIDNEMVATETQTETVNLFGEAEQFMISYLPQEAKEGGQLVRQEVWVYPTQQKKFSFLLGELVSVEDIKEEVPDDFRVTKLRPEDFEFYTSYKDLEKRFGKDNIAPLELPGFFDGEGGLNTYATKDAVFVFEGEYLTYMETLY